MNCTYNGTFYISGDTYSGVDECNNYLFGEVICTCNNCLRANEMYNGTNYTFEREMRFPIMWYVRTAKAQTSLRISAN